MPSALRGVAVSSVSTIKHSSNTPHTVVQSRKELEREFVKKFERVQAQADEAEKALLEGEMELDDFAE